MATGKAPKAELIISRGRVRREVKKCCDYWQRPMVRIPESVYATLDSHVRSLVRQAVRVNGAKRTLEPMAITLFST